MHLKRINRSCKIINQRNWSQTYNPAGDLIQLVNPLGAETNLTPDAVGRTIQTTNPLGYSTQLQYNGLDSITSIQWQNWGQVLQNHIQQDENRPKSCFSL